MEIKYNNQKVKKIKYNGKYIDKIKYNGTDIVFGSYNNTALQSFADKPTINASIENAEAVVNLHNGVLKISIPDVVFGNSVLGIGVGHIYNSMMDNDEIYKAKWTFMGRGFKLNYQQYLIKVNDELYYYIDGTGTKHEIVPAINGTIFYDTSGLGLILSEDDISNILTDRNNNRMIFDKTTGFIEQIINNLNHKTIIRYDNFLITQITKIAVNQTRTMSFKYDDSDRLSRITYDDIDRRPPAEIIPKEKQSIIKDNVAEKTIEYTYLPNSNLLDTITKKSSSEEQLLIKVEYDNNKKISSIRNIANQAIQFHYLTDKKISIIQEGMINNNFESLKNQVITYNQDKKNTQVDTRLKNLDNYENQVNILYQYNYKGNLISSYEICGNHLTSILPASNIGTRLFGKADGSIPSFNGVKIEEINKSSLYNSKIGYLVSNFSSNNTSAVVQAINNTDYALTYTFSFWYKTIKKPEKSASVRLYFNTIDFGSSIDSYEIEQLASGNQLYIEKKLPDNENWTFVSFEHKFGSKFQFHDFQMFINAPKDDDFAIQITDLRAISTLATVKIKDGNQEADIRKINNINCGININIKDVRDIVNDEEYFITAQDITWNQLEFYKGNSYFYLNNGQKLIKSPVRSIIMNAENQIFYFQANSSSYSFLEYEMIKDKELKICSYSYYEKMEGHYCLREIAKGIKGNLTLTNIKKIYNKYGLIEEEIDEYDIQTFYQYDDFGNVVHTLIQYKDTKDNSLKLYQSKVYDKNGNIEQILDSQNNSMDYIADNLYANIKTVINANKKLKTEYQYDSMMEKVKRINDYIGSENDTLYRYCNFTYSMQGQLETIIRSDGKKYSFSYDNYGNLNCYFMNDKTIQKRKTEYGKDGIIRSYKYMNEAEFASEHDWHYSKYDKYGRLTSKNDIIGGKIDNKYSNVFYDYNNNDSQASLIREIKDNYSKINYEFDYDINESLYKYSYSGEMSGSIEAVLSKDIYQSKHIYYHRNKKNEETIFYDDSKIINPRIIGFSDDCSYGSDYKYDNLGRICYMFFSGTHYEIEYKNIITGNQITSTTNNVETIKTYITRLANGRMNLKRYSLEYNNNNDITRIKIFDTSGSVEKEENILTYSYNEFGRLKSEGNKNLNYIKQYEYNLSGNITKVYQDEYGVIPIFDKPKIEYNYNALDKDKLNSITTYDNGYASVRTFEYDQIGNPIKYKISSTSQENNMIWTRGNLLSTYKIDGKEVKFEYNEAGFRIKKSNSDIVYKYHLDGSKITGVEKWSNNLLLDIYIYHYGLDGLTSITTYYGKVYNFEKDALGNISSIKYDGEHIATFTYDAWGNFKTKIHYKDYASILEFVPFRWKGYQFDDETGLYYINGNYYDPTTGRYINCNDLADLVTNNAKIMDSGYALEKSNPVGFIANIDNYKNQISLAPKFDKQHINWGALIMNIVTGVSLILLGIATIGVGGVGFGGICLGILVIFAGVANIIVGIVDILTATTNYNFIRGAFNWNQSQYNKFKTGLAIVSFILTIISTVYISYMNKLASLKEIDELCPRANCFKRGTMVKTKEGFKIIEKIKEGDLVWAYDEKTGKKELKEVIRLFRNQKKRTTSVTIDDNEPIVATPEHPFYILNAEDTPIVMFEGRDSNDFAGQWVAAGNLKVGHKVLLSNGKNGIITKVETEDLDEPITTYNFEVEDFHTYYVGEEGVLVHNDCPLSYLDDALGQNGYTRSDIPELTKNGTWRHSWSKDGTDYNLWIHKANSKFHSSAYTFRVQSRVIGTNGWKFLGANGAWYPATYVAAGSDAFKPFLMRITHIHLNL